MAALNIPPAQAIPGAEHLHSGKVRDLYRLTEGEHAGRLLMVASDRISAFDHVLASTIPDKGEILTRMSLWWFEQLGVAHHVVSTDVPAQVKGRAVICAELEMFPVECVSLSRSSLRPARLRWGITMRTCPTPLSRQSSARKPQQICAS